MPDLKQLYRDAACSYGAPREDAFHYFFTCPNYTEIRRIMMNNLNWVQTSDWNLSWVKKIEKKMDDVLALRIENKRAIHR
jgi:Gpi18-like mannosyltransferase